MPGKRMVLIILFILLFTGAGALSVIASNNHEDNCASCHEGVARDWEKSAKVEVLECEDCHGQEHTGPGDAHLVEVPTPLDCAECHPTEVERFEEGKHAYAWEAMKAVPTYEDMPRAVTDKGCVICHQIGYQWEDGSRGRCDSCHSRHVFSAAEAREPESCGHCHTGDHPQYEMWQSSKHGMIYAIEGDPERAPTCVTCHMPEGDHYVMTAWGFLGMRGEEDDPEWEGDREKVLHALEEMGPARAPNIMRDSMEKWEELREEMIDICSQCHAPSYVRRDLEKSDALLREADLVKAQLVDLTNQFYEEGLIDERTRFNIFRDATAHRFKSYMGAFHNSPLYAWDEGFLALTADMVYVRDDLVKEKKLDVFSGMIIQSLYVGSAALVISAGLFIFTVTKVRKKKKEEEGNREEK
ncbi:MAG: cytochrome C [Candidatus Syntrophonatronum acetioxidans]|uniref:Cytochrome C n=1 Tax=Candidatus Syntrophonatronum acetioxidans TaxID=1795816 RepID=A0A424YIX0_9FIRM|nr:MAG: cytochrome C [Candidatus Syntrophonatronum acetioxidans]